ncbi:ATP-binding cassette domain-containing protein [Cryobacterium sinapicolor]|uniref:ATP-binding cassette domain-containing protein n=1 Tax=Cryobacterium sinapicolor TaxID=1259236 RepID=A0ABY2J6E6_9MICO|nr:ATP-binding cassette domain-containing protein [Cryobacterium sinapicolor]TFD00503.1 ATP-binding cassette domain-containing protein [Cryobacterium sinapicolor]
MRLELASLDLSFGSRAILSGADLVAESSETVALMGPSGSGKSSLLGIVSGALKPDGGSVSLIPAESLRLAWILQSTPLLARRTALENVELGPLSEGYSVLRSRALALSSMKKLGVAQVQRQRVYTLSGGERQRLAVARAIAAHANVILADEPTASLDPESREAVCSALLVAAGQGALVLVATHDRAVADRCSRAYSISDGKLIALARSATW